MVNAQLDRRRLCLVLDRLESPHDGEKLAAIAAAGRILRAGGSTWRDLLTGLEGDDHASTSRVDDVDDGEPVAAQHHQDAAELLRHAGDELTAWERSFLRGCIGFPRLSEKQRRTLAEIRRKVAAMHGADA